MGYSMIPSEFYNREFSVPPDKHPMDRINEQFQLVGQADIGQTIGADLRHSTYYYSYSHPLMPVCPGHYNHMYLYGNPRIGLWMPRFKQIDEDKVVVLVWFGNSFKIVHESECNYCLHSGWRDRDGVRPIERIDAALRSR